MNCHNGEKYLDQSIRSVLNQSYENWELIFFNNSSKDKSKNIINNYLQDKRIKYFESNKFLNLYDARNQAIRKSKGQYIRFLDTDDYWDKNKLQIQLNFIKKNNCKMLYSKYYILNQIKKKKYLNKKRKLISGNLTQSFLDDYSVGILTAIFKRSIFDKIRFNKRYNIVGDFDFFLRVSLFYKIYVINKPLATYRHHELNLSNIKLDTHIQELNSWIKKNAIKFKSYSLVNLKFYIFKLKLKKILKKI